MATSSLGALILTIAFASSWAILARANTYDGLPRLKGFPDAPTVAYGSFPTVYVGGTNQTADCEWYGFANVGFPANIGLQCLAYLRAGVVEEANQNTLKPYEYYTCRLDGVCLDRVSTAYYCFHKENILRSPQGKRTFSPACYFLTNSGLAIPPVTAPAAPVPPPPPSPVLPPPGTPAALVPPPGSPAALLPPPGGSIIGQPPPPAPAAPRTTSAGSRSLQECAPFVVLLAFCAAAVNLITRNP